MNLEDFSTLAEAQAHTEVSTDIFSASTMRIYLKKVGLYLYLIDLSKGKFDQGDTHHPAKEDVLLLCESLNSPNADGKDFNFIIGTSFGEGNIEALDGMINNTLTEKASQLTALKSICIARSNKEYKPFEFATQEEFDAAKLKGESVCAVTYDGGDKFVTVGKSYFNISATLTEPAVRDILVKCKYRMSKGEGLPYTPVSREYHFTIPAGEVGFIEANLPTKGMHRWVEFEAIAELSNINCTVDITGV